MSSSEAGQCSEHSIPTAEFAECFVESDSNTTYILNTNTLMDTCNICMLKELRRPCGGDKTGVHLLAESRGPGTWSMDKDQFCSLENALYLAVGAKVSMTCIVCQNVGWVNGAMGMVKDLVYVPNMSPRSLPQFVWVDFCQTFTGLSLLPDDNTRCGWVPVHQMTMSEYKGDSCHASYTTHTQSQFPLHLAFTCTPWKAQGQSFCGKDVADLGSREQDHGLTYMFMSCITQLHNLCFIHGFTFDCFGPSINNFPIMVACKTKEVGLHILLEATMEMLGP
jgi:hypothetical protein